MRRGAFLAMGLSAACLSSPSPLPEIAGNYVVTVVNGENGCHFTTDGSTEWAEGAATSNVPVVLERSGDNATLVVEGLAGVYLNFVLGTNRFAGTVESGGQVEMLISRTVNMGSCSVDVIATLTARGDENSLEGQIDYAVTRADATCTPQPGCHTLQDFVGIRTIPDAGPSGSTGG